MLVLESNGSEAHATRGRDGRQEGSECGYYYLHRNLNDPLFHSGVTREGLAPLCSASCAQDGASPCVSLEIPIVISSGYRSEEVNRLCGGAKGSNHLTGCAVDIKCYGPEHMIRMASILLDIADGTRRDFDELILEKRGTTYWIHFAVRPEDCSATKGYACQSKNRRKILFDCR